MAGGEKSRSQGFGFSFDRNDNHGRDRLRFRRTELEPNLGIVRRGKPASRGTRADGRGGVADECRQEQQDVRDSHGVHALRDNHAARAHRAKQNRGDGRWRTRRVPLGQLVPTDFRVGDGGSRDRFDCGRTAHFYEA